MSRKERVYKTKIGAIPKIVNNFKPKTLNQKIFYDIISEDYTLISVPPLGKLQTRSRAEASVEMKRLYKQFYFCNILI